MTPVTGGTSEANIPGPAARLRPPFPPCHAAFALPITDAERQTVRRYTGRETPPSAEIDEAVAIVGRRGGMSQIAALMAVYLATFRDWRPYLGPGERAHVVVIAQSQRVPGCCREVCVRCDDGALGAGGVRGCPLMSTILAWRKKGG
jgi:hypothetical protein